MKNYIALINSSAALSVTYLFELKDKSNCAQVLKSFFDSLDVARVFNGGYLTQIKPTYSDQFQSINLNEIKAVLALDAVGLHDFKHGLNVKREVFNLVEVDCVNLHIKSTDLYNGTHFFSNPLPVISNALSSGVSISGRSMIFFPNETKIFHRTPLQKGNDLPINVFKYPVVLTEENTRYFLMYLAADLIEKHRPKVFQEVDAIAKKKAAYELQYLINLFFEINEYREYFEDGTSSSVEWTTKLQTMIKIMSGLLDDLELVI